MTTRDKLKKELKRAKEKVHSTHSRAPIEYAWYNAGALDAGIRYKKEFAVRWREKVLAIDGELTERELSIWYRTTPHTRRLFRVFSVNGKDKIAVCSAAGPRYLKRIVLIPDNSTAEDQLISETSYIG